MNSLKAFIIVLAAPIILVACFHHNVIKSNTERSPAVEKTVKQEPSLKAAIYGYLIAINNIK